MTSTSGIHHITAITADPQRNLDFYEGFLGQRLVKRTVNFDDPRSYHFYYGDESGKPGTLMTFFYWPEVPQGKRGHGEVSKVSYGISPGSKDFWIKRAREFDVVVEEGTNPFGERALQLTDPDGIAIDLVLTDEYPDLDHWNEGGVGKDDSLLGFYSATLMVRSSTSIEPVLKRLGYEKEAERGEHIRFVTKGSRAIRLDLRESSELGPAIQGAGSVHHIAVRAKDDAEELAMRDDILSMGLNPTPVIQRNYFRSVYFQTPANILFEIATDKPGNTIDEPLESLGEKLVLPEQYEEHRELIERMLVPITLPRHEDHGES